MGARRHQVAWLAAALGAAPAIARADTPEANPGRPSFSDNAQTTATGALELEAGLASEDAGASAAAQYTLKYGVTERFDVRLNVEHVAWGSAAALTGLGVLLKYTLRPPADRVLGVAIEPYVNAPVTAGWDEGGLLVGTYRFGDFGIDANVIVDVASDAHQPTAVTVTPVAAFGFPVVGPISGYIEPGVDLAIRGGGANHPYVGAGLAYTVRRFLVLDAACYVADAPRTLVLAGLTYSMYVPPRHAQHALAR